MVDKGPGQGKLERQVALGPPGMARRYGRDGAPIETERVMVQGMKSGEELLAMHEARVKEVARLEAGPLWHEVRNLHAMIDGLARQVDQLRDSRPVDRSLVEPAVEKGEGAELTDRLSPLKPWEREGISKSGWYKRKKKGNDHGSSGNRDGVNGAAD
jgi:hypothetical protein